MKLTIALVWLTLCLMIEKIRLMPRNSIDFVIILLILVLIGALMAYYVINVKDWKVLWSNNEISEELSTANNLPRNPNIKQLESSNSAHAHKNPLKVTLTKELVSDLSSLERTELSFSIRDNQLTVPIFHIDVNQGSDIHTTAFMVDNTITLLNEEVLGTMTTSTQPSTYALSATIDLTDFEDGEYIFKIQKSLWEVDKLTNVPPKKISKVALWDIFNIGSVNVASGFRKVKLYYPNNQLDQDNCRLVAPVVREIPVSRTVPQDTLNLLIQGELNEDEEKAGFSTEFPHNDFILNQAVLRSGVFTLNFSEVPGFTTGGSCWMMSLEAQITKTAQQFSEVRSVVFDPPVFQP